VPRERYVTQFRVMWHIVGLLGDFGKHFPLLIKREIFMRRRDAVLFLPVFNIVVGDMMLKAA
jgi:hypothetical protein